MPTQPVSPETHVVIPALVHLRRPRHVSSETRGLCTDWGPFFCLSFLCSGSLPISGVSSPDFFPVPRPERPVAASVHLSVAVPTLRTRHRSPDTLPCQGPPRALRTPHQPPASHSLSVSSGGCILHLLGVHSSFSNRTGLRGLTLPYQKHVLTAS